MAEQMTRRRTVAPRSLLAVLATVVCAALVPLVPVGSAPAAAAPAALGITAFGAIAVDPVSGRVFVSGDDEVVAFDAAGTYLATIGSVPGARGMSFDAGSLWVAETGTDAIARIDPATLGKIDEFPTGAPLAGGIATVGGLVWFTGAGGGLTGLRTLDPDTGTITDRGVARGAPLIEVPGEDDRLVLGSDLALVDTATTPVTVLGTTSATGQLRQAAATEVGTVVTATAGLYQFDELSLAPRLARLPNTALAYPASPYPNGITYSPARGGVFAGTTESSRMLYLWRRGAPAVAAAWSLPGEPAVGGVALDHDGGRAYSVHSVEGATGPLQLATYSLAPTIQNVTFPTVVRGMSTRGRVRGTALGSITSATLGGVPVEIAVEGDGVLVVDVTSTVPAGSQPLVLEGPWGNASVTVPVLDNPGGTLAGRITRGATPAGGVRVSITGESGDRSTTTASDGTYRMLGVPFGRHNDLQFTDPESGASVPFHDIVLSADAPWTYDLDLTDPPARTLQRRRIDLPPGRVRRLIVDPATRRTFVAVGDEVVALDDQGRLVGRVKDQWSASDLQVVGGKLYAMLSGTATVSEIDTTTLSVQRTLPLGRPTTGALAVTGGRVRFVNGFGLASALSSLSLADGTVSDSASTSVYRGVLAPVDGAPTHFLSWEVGLSSADVTHWDGTSTAPRALATSGRTVFGFNAVDLVASAAAGKVWVSDGRELSLDTMAPTGVTHATGGGGPAIARSAGHGGVLAFAQRVALQGGATPTHVLPATAAPRSVGIDAAGDRTFTATLDGKLVVADLAPVVNAITPGPVLTVPTELVVAGAGLGGATEVEVDGRSVPFSPRDANHLGLGSLSPRDGDHLLVVETPWGRTAPRRFTVTADQGPTAAAISDASGSVLGGEVVRLTGTGLDETTAVRFGDRTAPAFTVISPTELDVTVPAHPAGTALLTLTSADHDPVEGPAYRYLDPADVGGPLPTSVVEGASGTSGRPVAGDFTGDGIDDVLIHRPGPAADELRAYRGDGTFTSSTRSIGGTYRPISGDFTGDGVDDVFWYAPGPVADSLWDFNPGGGHTNVTIGVGGTYRPVTGDFTGDGVDDIFWHGPGTVADSLWDFDPGGGRTITAKTVDGSFEPVSGDFTGDGVDDVLWYAPGTTADRLWDFGPGGTHVSSPRTIAGTFTPVSGDFTGDDVDDVLWYAPGSAADRLWDFTAGGTHTSRGVVASMDATPVAADLTGGGVDDVFWQAATPAHDLTWFLSPVVS